MELPNISQDEKREIEEALSHFGLNKKEQDVYLALLHMDQTALNPLARSVGLPLTTAQSIVKRLADMGLIETTLQKSRHRYSAKNPVVLKNILKQKQEELAGIIPLLKNLQTEGAGAVKVKVYYRGGVADILQQALGTKDKQIYEIMSAGDFQKIMGESFHFTRRRLANKVRLKSLRIEEHEIKKYSKATHIRELREAKFLPRELTFRASVMFWEDSVAFFTPKEEGVCLVVESKVLRETMEQIFDLLWSVSRPMETLKD